MQGTFVRDRKDLQSLPVEANLIGFTDDLIVHGKKMEVKVLEIGTTSADEIIADFFKIPLGEKVTKIRRLRSVKNIPIYYAVQEIGVTKVNHIIAQLLSTNVFEPVLNILIRVYENKDNPIELVDMYCRTDKYKILVHLNKRNL